MINGFLDKKIRALSLLAAERDDYQLNALESCKRTQPKERSLQSLKSKKTEYQRCYPTAEHRALSSIGRMPKNSKHKVCRKLRSSFILQYYQVLRRRFQAKSANTDTHQNDRSFEAISETTSRLLIFARSVSRIETSGANG